MKAPSPKGLIPQWKNLVLAVGSAAMLILAFPDFDYWFLAWIAFVPLFVSITTFPESAVKTFVSGWVFGTLYFIGTVWWLTNSPIQYGGFPAWLAYTLLVLVCMFVGIFPASFLALTAVLVKRLGSVAILAAPFIWAMTEFFRYWISGNSWNAVGYSQAFGSPLLPAATVGGVYFVGFLVVNFNGMLAYAIIKQVGRIRFREDNGLRNTPIIVGMLIVIPYLVFGVGLLFSGDGEAAESRQATQNIVVTQANVPMAGLTQTAWLALRERHVELTENAIKKLRSKDAATPITVVFPESPMNFMYDDDPEFREFIATFAGRNNINVLFNSAEPDSVSGNYFNSAVMVDNRGHELAQYDKIYLVPFGEFVPGPLRAIVPGLIGSYASGANYNLFPLGDAKAGAILCYEMNFGQLSRRLVADGADVLIEMTNDGYLGKTPVLRQHLASAVFRAVETNRPVIRATNIGITAYVTPKGDVLDSAPIYAEATRVWQTSKSSGRQTFYVKFGDWIAWLGLLVTAGLLILSQRGRKFPA